jgi:hypothetical protein
MTAKYVRVTCDYGDWLCDGWSEERILVGARFSALALEPTQPPVQWVPGLSWG